MDSHRQVGWWANKRQQISQSICTCLGYRTRYQLTRFYIVVIARAMAASVDEMGVQARDEEAAATQGPPRKKKLLDEGSLQEIEEDAAAPSASSLPPGERAGVVLCLLSSGGGEH